MKIGIIGCGKIAVKAHLPSFMAIPEAEVVSVADIDEEKAKYVAKKFGVRKYFKDYNYVINDEEIDLVDICTTPETHAKIAINAASNGKHILVEKPIASNVREAVEMIKVAKRNGVRLCVVHNFRYFSAMQGVKRSILEGRIGNVTSIQGVCHQHFPLRWSPRTWWFNQGGVIYDIGIHMIDAILWLAEDYPKEVYAVGGDYLNGMNCVNQASVLIEFSGKKVALCDFSWLTGRTIFSIWVHGTAGHIFSDMCFNHFYEAHGVPTPIDEIKNFSLKMFTFFKDLISGRFFLSSLAYHKPLIEKFIESIKSKGCEPVSGEEALLALAVAEAIVQSINEKGKIDIMKMIQSKSGDKNLCV
jgi:predicted dehydrogenase